MVNLKTTQEIAVMKEGGAILATILKQLTEAAKPGTTTLELDKLARELISSHGGTPSFLNYGGFPAAICASINDEIVHGVPSDYQLQNGDLLKIDIGNFYKGFHTDTATTIVIGTSNIRQQKLIDVANEALQIGIEKAKPGNTIGDVGYAIQQYVEENGFNVIRDLIGHGVGKELHEAPEVPNYGKRGQGPKLVSGMTIAIEPMVVEGRWAVAVAPNGFTYVTKDKKLAVHVEHTIAITENGNQILTK